MTQPRSLTAHDADAIARAVASLPDGASRAAIAEALENSPPARTLQRWLQFMVDEGKIVAHGKGPALRYVLPAALPTTQPPAMEVEKANVIPAGIELSVLAEESRQMVRRPIFQRKPVGYNRDFLEQYRPNQTFYLPATVRGNLREMGQAVAGDLPAGTYARHILNRLLIDLSWNSSRLEGNTYSLLETERLLQLHESAEGKSTHDAQMILNHKVAIELLVEDAAEIGFNRYTILNLHGILAEGLLSDPEAGGRLRSIPVAIGGTVFHPLSVPQLVEECFDQILATASAIVDPFEQAFFSMVHLPYLQPFEDVNKRVSRLAANIPFVRFNLCPLAFVDVPLRDYVDSILCVYELNRVEPLAEVFAWAYERSCGRYSAVRQSLGEPDPFRLRYRAPLKQIVAEVIKREMDKKAAVAFVRQRAEAVPEQDRPRFIELVETELLSLHEGNFARYGARPSEFAAWQRAWNL